MKGVQCYELFGGIAHKNLLIFILVGCKLGHAPYENFFGKSFTCGSQTLRNYQDCFKVESGHTQLLRTLLDIRHRSLSSCRLVHACQDEMRVRGAPWSAANRLHGQRTGAFSWRPVLGLSRKTDQFRLDPTQNCAPGWWCDRVSSVYSPHTLEMLRHLPTYDQPPGFVPRAYQAPAPSLPPSNPP